MWGHNGPWNHALAPFRVPSNFTEFHHPSPLQEIDWLTKGNSGVILDHSDDTTFLRLKMIEAVVMTGEEGFTLRCEVKNLGIKKSWKNCPFSLSSHMTSLLSPYFNQNYSEPQDLRHHQTSLILRNWQPHTLKVPEGIPKCTAQRNSE